MKSRAVYVELNRVKTIYQEEISPLVFRIIRIAVLKSCVVLDMKVWSWVWVPGDSLFDTFDSTREGCFGEVEVCDSPFQCDVEVS